MRRLRILIPVLVLAILAISAGAFALVGAAASPDLPSVTPQELLQRVLTQAPQVTTASGEVEWKNDVLDPALLPLPADMAQFAPLLKEGKATVAVDQMKARLEVAGSQGGLAVYDGSSLYVHRTGEATATEYTGLTAPTEGTQAKPDFDPTQVVQRALAKLAPYAELSVAGQERVAGRDAYLLRLTPKADKAALGSLVVAIDGETYLPLRAEVFASTGGDAVAYLRFLSISYAAVPASSFTFTTPAGVKLEKVEAPQALREHLSGQKGEEGTSDQAEKPSLGLMGSLEMPKKLTLAEAQKEAGFTLLTPKDASFPFQGAAVVPAAVLQKMLSGAAQAAPGSDETGTSAPLPGLAPSGPGAGLPGLGDMGAFLQFDKPLVAAVYGQGFGSVVVIQTQMGDQQAAQLELALGFLRLFKPATLDGKNVYELVTPLGSVVTWRQGQAWLVLAGGVPQADLESLVKSVE